MKNSLFSKQAGINRRLSKSIVVSAPLGFAGVAEAVDLEDVKLVGGGKVLAASALPDESGDPRDDELCEEEEDKNSASDEDDHDSLCPAGFVLPLLSDDPGPEAAQQMGLGILAAVSVVTTIDPTTSIEETDETPTDPNAPDAQFEGVIGLADNYSDGLQVSFTRTTYDPAANDYEVFLDDSWSSMVNSGGTSVLTGNSTSMGDFVRRADLVEMAPGGAAQIYWIRGEAAIISQSAGGAPFDSPANTRAVAYAGDGNQNSGSLYLASSTIYHSSHGPYNNPPGPNVDDVTAIIDDIGNADIDGDGDTDLYILDYSSNTARVWDVDDNDATQLPDSSAALTTAWVNVRSKAVGFGASDVYGAVIWDFDGDGDHDDIVVNTDLGGLYYTDFLAINYVAPTGSSTDLLASWNNDTGVSGVDAVLGLDDSDGDGAIDSFLLTVYDPSAGSFEIFQFDDLANLGRQSSLGGDVLAGELESTCGYNGFYKANYSNGGSITSDFVTFSPYDVRTAVIDTSIDPRLSPGVIQVDQALMTFEYTSNGVTTTTMSMIAQPATPTKNSGDYWGVADLDGDNEAELWHWHSITEQVCAYEFDDLDNNWDITFDSHLSVKLNAAWGEIDAAANPTDIDNILIYDFDGDGDADLGLSADGATHDVAVYEFLSWL